MPLIFCHIVTLSLLLSTDGSFRILSDAVLCNTMQWNWKKYQAL